MKRVRLPGPTALGLALFLAGCVSRPMPPWDLGRSGWSVREVPAVWRPKSGAPDLSGELLLAIHADGSRLVQFSKQGVPLVAARADRGGWDVGSPMRPKGYSGKGRPPSRVLWFQVDSFPPTRPASARWSLHVESDGVWTLENGASGERLEAAP